VSYKEDRDNDVSVNGKLSSTDVSNRSFTLVVDKAASLDDVA